MKSILEYIQEKLNMIEPSIPIIEMATIDKTVKVSKNTYRIALHGPAVGDRPYPHFHVYLANDVFPYKMFNIEISLIDLLCYDELNIVAIQDKERKINIKNRNKCNVCSTHVVHKCSWSGYRKLHDKIEDWLEEPCTGLPGNFQNNLEALIWSYDNESNEDMSLLEYINDHGKKVLPKYEKYFKSY